jgi:hypothetical protein
MLPGKAFPLQVLAVIAVVVSGKLSGVTDSSRAFGLRNLETCF